jgi:nanoRNase/pAp phosphatase (c-di-AMP/oligoRNAs hydrolase)
VSYKVFTGGVISMIGSGEKFRLVTQSDFDGLVCAVLLKELDLIDDIKFVHPKDMQDGTILISENDITTNLPYVPGVHLAFDHHSSEISRLEDSPENHIIEDNAFSAARVVYNYYGCKERFANISKEMIDACDKGNSAQYTIDEILNPTGWVQMNYLMDTRTGLGRFREFKVSNYKLMMQLIDFCRDHTIDDILALPDVHERVELYKEHATLFADQVKRCATIHENLIILDIRDEETIYAGNRFMIYALYPECNISIHTMWGLNKLNTVFATGKSIVDRSSKTNIGDLMLQYGGGGHENAGTCQIENDEAATLLDELIKQITTDG